MAENSSAFLSRQILKMQGKRWEALGAQISNNIRLTVRIARSTANTAQTPSEIAFAAARSVEPEGWSLAGFGYDDAGVNVDLVHDLVSS